MNNFYQSQSTVFEDAVTVTGGGAGTSKSEI